MKITGSSNAAVASVTVGAQTVAAPVQAEMPAGAGAALQSEVLKPASEALRAMPDFDAARVAELRDALARGELPFDPGRLAGLIQKFHGGR
ncbi:negative regulator of flagellin synthesis FlgM [Massilia sp. UYP32]|uniref:Negative regulator of flagellin synthesis n=1 Tax=Massilia timonae TaxID=47229 RepID=A0A1S2NGP3_9BURK|nr:MULTISPECIES: flagellar biosynthesis anti-sigma factor FlgM [Massilia]OIJ43993.1 flagellar biosynthesis anti-sigma factor FlgM [Massilia timonae]